MAKCQVRRKPSAISLDMAFPGAGRIMRQLLGSEKAVRAHPAAIALEKASYHTQDLYRLRMEALNAAAGTHGVEYVPAGRRASAQGFCYLNTGDCYTQTLIRFDSGQYRIADIGSIIERGNYA